MTRPVSGGGRAAAKAPARREPTPPSRGPRSTSAQVVIYDVGSRSRESLTFGFEREDFEVFASDRADDAIGLIKITNAHILVISVGEDAAQRAEGLSFVGTLRDDPAHRHRAIVVLGRRELREDALRAGADEFVAWPAFIRDAVTLARLALAARAEQGTGLSGLLDDYEVYFLVRALTAASRSAIVELQRGARNAFIHLVRGEVVAAKVGRLTGVAAFHHLLLWADATLRLRFSSPPGERKIEVPIEDLLQSGVHFVREFEDLAARVGGPQAIFERRAARDGDKVKVPAEVRRFAETIPPGVTLVDLVEQSPFKPLDTIKVCYRLSELGLIARRDPVRSISPLTAQLAVRDWLLGTAAAEPRSTVTEAGRRAAEAYAEAAALRAQADATSIEDILTAPTLTPPAGVVALPPAAPPIDAPRPVEDIPTAPREALRGPSARNKGRGSQVQRTAKAAPYADPPRGHTGKVPKTPREEGPVKEPVFDEIDEAFFAGEAELGRIEPVESFADLDDTGRKRRLSEKRGWSIFGDKPAPPKGGRKKR